MDALDILLRRGLRSHRNELLRKGFVLFNRAQDRFEPETVFRMDTGIVFQKCRIVDEMDCHLYPLRDEMNGRCFKHRKYFRPGSKLQILDSLPRDECHEFKSDINYNSRQHAGGNKCDDSPAQMVSCAALLRTALFQGDVLAANAYVELCSITARIGRRDLRRPD